MHQSGFTFSGSAAQANGAAATAVAGTKDKITELEKLADIINAARARGQKVVHCHGVFDLLHIGHIRHFEEARKQGDLLVVTLTPDRFVNKGPHRPAFSETLRAEAIAALNCVDFVAINQWPMAVELIKFLRPHYYVKGSDYKDAEKDVTGGIALEKAAVESVGGQLVFTDDIVFSSSTLINRHMPVFSKELSEYLKDFADKYSVDDIVKYLDMMKPLKVLTIGEAIIDEYQYCEAIGKSSKEPMLAVRLISSEKFAGGILAVGNNVANFSDNVGLLSLLGEQDSQEDFIRSSLSDRIRAELLTRQDAPTIVKRRIIDNYFFHKLLAVYTINDQQLTDSDDAKLCAKLEQVVPEYDAVIVVDFGHSMITPRAAEVICKKAKFLAVNTQSNAGNLGYQTIFKYNRADYVCITENELRLEVRDRAGDVTNIMPRLGQKLSSKRVVITRGKRGCVCYSEDEGFCAVPAVAGQVVDRMGAGDAFLSVTAMAAALNAPLELLGFVGNAVGAQAVSTVGHRDSINRSTLTKFITSLLK
jgi:rfaE bifunctional protein kinase chain/domain/rfaE bifunctional protein nucleotidyltransferase chain/domain